MTAGRIPQSSVVEGVSYLPAYQQCWAIHMCNSIKSYLQLFLHKRKQVLTMKESRRLSY